MYLAEVWAGTTFGRVAACGDDAVNAVRGADVLPQQADSRLRDRQRVRRIDPQLGKRRGVRSLPV